VKRGLPSNLVIAASSEIVLDAGAPPQRVQLLPLGTIPMRDGRGPYVLKDKAHAEAVVAATRDWLGSADLMLDYDHQALYAPRPGVGGTAIAAGWIKPDSLQVDDAGISGEVDWTVAAGAKLAAREYRYISPTFMAARATGEVLHLKNAALVNIPAIDLPAIAAGFSHGDDMTLAAIAKATGLGEDATEAQILAAIGTMKSSGTGAIAIAAGLAATATVEEVTAAVTDIRGKVVDLSLYVPKSIVEPLQEEVKRSRAKRLAEQVDVLVAGGVVPPMKRKDALDWFEKDEVAAAAYYKDMPAIVVPGAKPAGSKPDPITTLTEEQVAAAAMLGMSEAEYIAAKNEEIA
jgi:phage I-like protein